MNTIYIELSDGHVMTAPIMDDLPIEAVSEFSTFGELVPIMDQLVTLGTAFSAGGGTTSKTAVLARSILDAPRWTKTNPVKITIDMHFYTETDPDEDVVNKVNTLLGLHLLSIGEKGRIKIPGFKAKNIKDISNALTDKKQQDKVKTNLISFYGTEEKANEVLSAQKDSIIGVLIPGIVYLPFAYIHAVQPTYSKFKTESGLPLWATVNVQIVSLTPAMFENFENGRTLNDISDNLLVDLLRRE